VGRNRKYETHIKPYLAEIVELCKTHNEAEIAGELGVSYTTFNRCKKEQTELKEALRKGKRVVVPQLRMSLLKRANGFEKATKKAIKCKTVEYKNGKKVKEEERVEYYEEVTYYPPDVAALNLALKNYDKDNWSNDPQLLALKKEELEIKKQSMEDW